MPDAFNPYAPPQTLDRAQDDLPEPRLGIYQPQLSPRDAVDIFLGLGIGIPGALLLYGLPIVLIVLLGAPAILMPIVVVSLLLAAIVAVLCGIQRVTVTAEGLLARRFLLPDVRVTWPDLTNVRRLTRLEALRGTILTPHRFCSQSLTYRDYVRFETRNLYFAFAPRDVEMFRTTIESLWPQRDARDCLPGQHERSPL